MCTTRYGWLRETPSKALTQKLRGAKGPHRPECTYEPRCPACPRPKMPSVRRDPKCAPHAEPVAESSETRTDAAGRTRYGTAAAK